MSIIYVFLFSILFLVLGIAGILLGRYIDSNQVKNEGSSSFLVGIIIFLGLIFSVDVIRKAIMVSKEKDGNWHWGIDVTQGSIPEYLACFISAIAAVYLYKTLREQRKATDEQKRANQISQFEARFFKFIDYHRENVNNLEYRDPKNDSEKYWKGNQVFTVIYYEIVELAKEFFNSKFGKSFTSPKEKKIVIDFIYQCVFYGSGKHTKKILTDKFDGIFFEQIDFFYKRATYLLNGKFAIYYSGHVRRLGHYFRNIYQAIQYIEQQDFLSYNQKYDYVATLRAQMSVYEQAVFFYNSLSGLGNTWEIKRYSQYNISSSNKSKIFNKLWVTKYDLIRNTLNNDGIISDGIKISDYYPLLNLEREEELCKSGKLIFKNESFDLCRTCFNAIIGFNINEESALEEVNTDAPNFKVSDEIKCSEGDKCLSKKILKKLQH